MIVYVCVRLRLPPGCKNADFPLLTAARLATQICKATLQKNNTEHLSCKTFTADCYSYTVLHLCHPIATCCI